MECVAIAFRQGGRLDQKRSVHLVHEHFERVVQRCIKVMDACSHNERATNTAPDHECVAIAFRQGGRLDQKRSVHLVHEHFERAVQRRIKVIDACSHNERATNTAPDHECVAIAFRQGGRLDQKRSVHLVHEHFERAVQRRIKVIDACSHNERATNTAPDHECVAIAFRQGGRLDQKRSVHLVHEHFERAVQRRIKVIDACSHNERATNTAPDHECVAIAFRQGGRLDQKRSVHLVHEHFERAVQRRIKVIDACSHNERENL